MKDALGFKNSPMHNKKAILAILDILDKFNPSQMSELVYHLNQIHENAHCFSREDGYYWCRFSFPGRPTHWDIYTWKDNRWSDKNNSVYDESDFDEIDECKIGRDPLDKVTRVEVIDENGRSYSNTNQANKVTMMLQDDDRTLKIFIKG